MHFRRTVWLVFFWAMPCVVRAQSSPPCPTDPREIIRVAAENDDANDVKARSYTYMQRDEEHKLDSKGSAKSTESKTYEVLFLGGEQTQKVVEKNDKPLSADDAKKEDEKLDKLIKKRENETPDEKQKRLKQEEKDRQEERAFVSEIADAYNFTLHPQETLSGRDTVVISGEPKPDFHARTSNGKYLSKFRFQVWIDQEDCEWVKIDVEAIDTVSWGLFIARLHKGSRVYLEQTHVNNELWLPKSQKVILSARVALMKNYNLEEDTTYWDYQKFATSSRILPGATPASSP